MTMRITEGKGFHMDLPNGVTVSVQFGPGNYCDRRFAPLNAPTEAAANHEHWEADQAECAAYLTDAEGTEWVAVPGFTGEHDDVCGWLDAQGVLNFINAASKIAVSSDVAST